ncbi:MULTISPECIES: MFS transporter [Lysinibacillus]|uniref:MFS transporter n=1 Tax=Lysinibacillus antri TaxID=2498145 RepID=A0A3S0P4Q2_9BACI|nr:MULTISPECIES: MFS transporter [Lysinibacillus]RUL50324.1 MFS transporter [Lysinibacillus antri]TSI08287.1 MFS transporter [Lysinibacillus sp. BW-2-10]
MATIKTTNQKKGFFSSTSTILFIIAIIFFATTLRTPITAVGPIISDIREGLGISNVLAGFLTTIPLLAFAIVSPFAPRVSRMFGMEKTLFYSVILLTIGIVLRSLGTVSLLIFGTALIGIAISFGNVLMQGFFKLKYPYHIGLLTGIYTVAMNVSAGVSIGISNPIASNPTFGWQGALAFSVILTLITLVVWIPLLRGEKVDLSSLSSSDSTKEETKLWKSPLAWMIAIAMGFQSILFYCSTTWLPEILISQGYSETGAGLMTSVMTYAQIPMTFIIPILAEKLKSQRPIVIFFTVCYLFGFAGLLFEWTNLAFLWMVLLGLAGGASFGLCLMLFTLRTRTAYEAAQISGFAQSVGYLLAAVGPVLFGYLHDATGSWNLPIWLFIVATIVLLISAYMSSKESYI